MLKPLITTRNYEARPEVIRARRMYGVFYGVGVALAFAAWNWGMDAVMLSQANALEPWFKFLVGLAICLPVGALAGWLTMRLESGLYSALIWLVASMLFAWLTVALPFQIAPRWLAASNDLPSNFTPTVFEALFVRVSVAYVWTAIFVTIAGLLELPMGETAAFSTSLGGRLGPTMLCVALMGIAGFIVDNLNNAPFREPLMLTDKTIQFVIDHQGQQVDPKLARTMHMSALRTITDVVDRPRQLLVGEFDQSLGNIHILVRFGDQWVDCLTVYNQMSGCQMLSP